MNSISDSQTDESAYQETTYYGTLDGSLNDPDGEYQTGDASQKSPLREQDRFLPIANVSKIMKRAIPSNGKVAKDAKECVQECVSEFISFITSEAAERCQNEKRKTINGEDILWAMSSLGFDNYVDPLKTFLVKLRDASKIDSSMLDGSVLTNSICVSHTNTMIMTPTVFTASTPMARTAQLPVSTSGSLNTLDMADVKPLTEEDLKSTATMTAINTSSAAGVNPGSAPTTILVPYSGQVTIVNGSALATSATT